MIGRYKYHLLLWISLSLYTISSYLLLFKDAFILERLGVSVGNPLVEITGLLLAEFLKVNYSSTLVISLALGIGCFAWFKLINLSSNTAKVFSWMWIMVFVATLFISFPALSTDVFDYNNANRVAFIHKADPWENPANTFPQDSEIYFGSWLTRGSVYPPITFVTSSLVYGLFGGQTVFAVIGFKLLALVFYLLILLVLQAQKVSESKLLSIAYNPLILIEFIGNAHNDLILGSFLLLSFIYLLKNRSEIWSGFFLGLGVMSKFSLLLYAPFIVWKLWQDNSNSKAIRWILGFVAVNLVIYSLFLNSFNSLLINLSDQFGIYQKSLPTVIRYFGILWYGESNIEMANQVSKYITLPLFGLFSLYLVYQSKKIYIADFLILIMMFYLFIQAPMLQPWYLAWFLPIVPFAKSKSVYQASLVFCISALATYPVYFMSLYFNPLNIIWQLILALTMIAPPILSFLLPRQWYTRK